jgi:hypothetical protein
MSTYYFSGIDRASFVKILASEGAAGMVNACNATQPAMIEAYRRWPEVPLVLDSGAFQGVTDVTWYAEVVHKVGDRFVWIANLDVIGDQSASDRNWHELYKMDCEPLWIYQVEGGASLRRLEKEVDSNGKSIIGIGGLVPVIKRSVDEAMYLIQDIGEILRPWCRAHFFGVSSARILAEFGREPWFASADSQSWLSGMKARELFTRDGRRVRCDDLGLELSREECAQQNIRQVHTWMSGRPIQFSLLQN